MRKYIIALLFCTGVGTALVVTLFILGISDQMKVTDSSDGNVVITTNQGEVLGYYGKVKINSDGSSSQADIDMTDAWLVGEAKEDKDTGEVKPLVIEVPEPTHEGRITVYDQDGEIIYDYQGDFIRVLNDGKNGEQIEVEVNIPYDKDSCFQEEGE